MIIKSRAEGSRQNSSVRDKFPFDGDEEFELAHGKVLRQRLLAHALVPLAIGRGVSVHNLVGSEQIDCYPIEDDKSATFVRNIFPVLREFLALVV
jgi:hypothetical protein